MNKLKHISHKALIAVFLLVLLAAGSCKKGYFDKIPDNITTIQSTFNDYNLSLKWLERLYSQIPDPWDIPYGGNPDHTYPNPVWPAMTDELELQSNWRPSDWPLPINAGTLVANNTTTYNYWIALYQNIRNASIYLANIDNRPDLISSSTAFIDPDIKDKLIPSYKSEARFLRAYYYFQLMKTYGPVVLMGEKPLADTSNFQLPRNSWQECVDYVVSEIDAAIPQLPENPLYGNSGTGHITSGIAKAFKSQVLLFDASPLYNGNTELADFKNQDGKQLINQTYDVTKWKKAADAAKAVIDLGKWSLYYDNTATDPFDKAVLSTKELFWNGAYSEGIWVRPSSAYYDQWAQHSSPRNSSGNAWNGLAVLQELVDAFGMAETGAAIDDPGSGYTESGFTATGNSYYVDGTSNMYVGREPRFYAYLNFNGATPPVQGGGARVEFYNTGTSGKGGAPNDWTRTGYTPRKNIPKSTDFGTGADEPRPAMLIRLAEIYLNYAEALNEAEPGNPDVLVYLNKIRDRAGLAPVASGLSQAEMRRLIHRERRVELCFEGQRYFDVRRWKTVNTPEDRQGGAFYGMAINAGTSLSDPAFHQRTADVIRAAWSRKNYFWPIPQAEIERDFQLVQFPGY